MTSCGIVNSPFALAFCGQLQSVLIGISFPGTFSESEVRLLAIVVEVDLQPAIHDCRDLCSTRSKASSGAYSMPRLARREVLQQHQLSPGHADNFYVS